MAATEKKSMVKFIATFQSIFWLAIYARAFYIFISFCFIKRIRFILQPVTEKPSTVVSKNFVSKGKRKRFSFVSRWDQYTTCHCIKNAIKNYAYMQVSGLQKCLYSILLLKGLLASHLANWKVTDSSQTMPGNTRLQCLFRMKDSGITRMNQ